MWRITGAGGFLLDCSRRIGTVGEFKRVAINDRVVCKPERRGNRHKQSEPSEILWPGMFGLVNHSHCRRECHNRQEPAIVPSEARAHQTQATFHRGGGSRRLKFMVPQSCLLCEFKEVDNPPDKQSEV